MSFSPLTLAKEHIHMLPLDIHLLSTTDNNTRESCGTMLQTAPLNIDSNNKLLQYKHQTHKDHE